MLDDYFHATEFRLSQALVVMINTLRDTAAHSELSLKFGAAGVL